jgi:hypothetical protein
VRTLAIVLVLAAAIVGALFALGFFESKEQAPPVPTPPPEAGTGPGGLASRIPETEPPLEAIALKEPVNGLMLMEFPQRFNLFLLQQWKANKKLRFRAWGLPREGGPEGENRPDMSAVEERLENAPSPALLDADDIQVLVLHDLDPNVLEKEFWEAAAERVRAGKMGLLVIPGVRTGRAILEHEVLRTLLPIAKADDPVATAEGATSKAFPFELTKEGAVHPATRLVKWPEWSIKIWVSRRSDEFPWGTKFCYPVEQVVEGSEVLLEAERMRGPPIPAIVVGPQENGRVLWVGTWELGDRSKDDSKTSYGHAPTVAAWGTLVCNWVSWLAGGV